MTIEEIQELISQVECLDYEFRVIPDDSFCFLQGFYDEPCVVTGNIEPQTTRKWRISSHMTKSEIVQTILKCALTSQEHRVREHFKYKGELVYGPHFDVDALWEIARKRRLDLRPEWPRDMSKPLSVEGSKEWQTR